MDELDDKQRDADSGRKSERLESWKAIARYLGRTVRTAHRWEKEEGLPVRRHLHRAQSTVYAYTSEIDAWWEGRAGTRPKSRHRLRDRVGPGAAVLLLVVAALFALSLWRTESDPETIMPNSVAVLPFAGLTGSQEERLLGHALAEELLNRLSSIDSLSIIARTSSFAFGNDQVDPVEVAKLLRVEHIIVGTMQYDDDRVLVNARLLDGKGRQVWAQAFERSVSDLFSLQRDLAEAVARSVAPHFDTAFAMADDPDPAAYQLFLLGREHLRLGNVPKAIESLQKALGEDPDLRVAEGTLAWALAHKSQFLVARATYDEATVAARDALASDPDSPTGHLALGIVALGTARPQDAIASFERALASDPQFVDARLWLSRARQAAGVLPASDDDLALALRIDPLHPLVNRELAARYWARGDADAALDLLTRLLSLPEPPQPTYADLVAINREFGRLDESLEWARRAALAVPKFVGIGATIISYGRLGMFDEADKWLQLLTVAENGVPRLGWRSEDLYIRGRFDDVLQLKTEHVDRSGVALERLPFQVQETLGGVLIVAGRLDEGITLLEPWFGADFELHGHLREYPLTLSFAQMLVHAYQATGRDKEATRLLGRIDAHLAALRDAGLDARPNFDLVRARQAALRRQDDAAIRHLRDAIVKGWRDTAFERRHPAWRSMAGNEQLGKAFAGIEAEIRQMRTRLRQRGPDDDLRASVLTALFADRPPDNGDKR